jgi:outer membrane protein OmpA-like peptidoglycan-associated protein
MNFGKSTGYVSRLGAVIVVAAALGGCSMMPDWLTGDSDTAATADSTTPAPDQSADANAAYPDLADTPNRPAAPSTTDDQKQVADSLGAAQARQDYNTEQLRAGTETAAAPPPAEAPKDDIAEVNPDSKSTPDADSDASTAAPAPAPATTDTASSAADNTAPAAAPASAPTTAVASAPVLSGAPSGPPAVPAVPAGSSVVGAQAMQMTDTQLGFQPSKAPPLDATVAQFVPQPIMSRYRETAAVSSTPAFSGGPAVPAAPYRGPSVGGPEMSGAVVANFDSLQGGAVAPGIAGASGMPATASIVFPHDTTILSAAAKAEVLSAAQAFNAQGGAGYIRVVGHASSRSANMSVSRHLQWDFDHSQARATSVARALIAAGVPADKVLVNAVGDDNQSDEENSRRADIFFQN